MFEKMKNNVTRIPGNLKKLNQYQKDLTNTKKTLITCLNYFLNSNYWN